MLVVGTLAVFQIFGLKGSSKTGEITDVAQVQHVRTGLGSHITEIKLILNIEDQRYWAGFNLPCGFSMWSRPSVIGFELATFVLCLHSVFSVFLPPHCCYLLNVAPLVSTGKHHKPPQPVPETQETGVLDSSANTADRVGSPQRYFIQ